VGSPLVKRLGSTYPSQGAGTFLPSGETVTFRLPQGPAVFTGGFRIEAPPGTRSIRIDVDSWTPGADLDVLVRLSQDGGLNLGEESDYQAARLGTLTKSILIDATSNPPIKTGFYFIALFFDETNYDITIDQP